MNETTTTVVGNLITQVDRRTTATGRTRASFRVAGKERRFDRSSQSWGPGDSLYVSVTCWRGLADNVHASLSVGDPIIVHGRLHSRSYERDGKQQTVLELEAYAVGPDLSWSTAAVTRTKRSEPAPAPSPDTAPPSGGGAWADRPPAPVEAGVGA
ncbi:single-stranded DNA-binding protein [Pseudonocardia nigra]|uniref:single-stranded DNA-binding protein n=1 Tax=Pseudonocardia nigra TaxID=1921578 RepID=UPI001C603985|nr:single-stranded DNA-binding protein [Pseudonocardia nigra]